MTRPPGDKIPPTIARPDLLTAGSDRDFRDTLHHLLAFATRLDKLRDGFAKLAGLTGPQYSILMSIARLTETGDPAQGCPGAGVNQVAAHLHLSGTFVTTATNALHKAGLVEKCTDGHDRRRVRLCLTHQGHGLLDRLGHYQRPVNAALFEAVGADDFAILARLASGLVQGADRAQALQDFLARTPFPVDGGAEPSTISATDSSSSPSS